MNYLLQTTTWRHAESPSSWFDAITVHLSKQTLNQDDSITGILGELSCIAQNGATHPGLYREEWRLIQTLIGLIHDNQVGFQIVLQISMCYAGGQTMGKRQIAENRLVEILK